MSRYGSSNTADTDMQGGSRVYSRHTAVQNQDTVSAHFTSKQILRFGVLEQLTDGVAVISLTTVFYS